LRSRGEEKEVWREWRMEEKSVEKEGGRGGEEEEEEEEEEEKVNYSKVLD